MNTHLYSGTKPADWGQRSQFGQAQTTGGSSGWVSGSTGLAALLLLGNQIKPVGRLPYLICIYLTAMRPYMLQMNCTEYFCLDCMCSRIFLIYTKCILFSYVYGVNRDICEQHVRTKDGPFYALSDTFSSMTVSNGLPTMRGRLGHN